MYIHIYIYNYIYIYVHTYTHIHTHQIQSVYSIKIKCQYNKKKLDKFIKKLDKNHVKTVVDARITKGGTITAPKEGRSLKLDKIKDNLKEYLQADTKENYKAEYKTKAIKPEWNKEDLSLRNLTSVIPKSSQNTEQDT